MKKCFHGRIKKRMEGDTETTENQDLEGRQPTQSGDRTAPPANFVKVEKNLASLGFFTPSSKRTRNEKAKTVSVTIVVDGKRIEAKATIAPTALFGLPITADQDKWLALHKILSDVQVRDGQVTNPVSFTSAELLALLNIYKDSGKNYRDVSEWLDVMVGTTIISEGAVYAGGKRYFGKDAFHVFDRAVSFGKQLPDGRIADKNYVWLSDWQLQNINRHHQLPVDLDAYRQLKNFIAKALVPLLQVWLYATRDDGVFEKRYDELCQILNVRQWNYPSKIKEKLGPSLDELKQFGYLSDWRIERASDKRTYKILFFHGEKFHRDRRARLARGQAATQTQHVTAPGVQPRVSGVQPVSPDASSFSPELINEFTERGITKQKATELLRNRKPEQDIVAQLEFADYVIANSKIPIQNPPGFRIRLVASNTSIPDSFETNAKRDARLKREEKEREARSAEEARQQLEWAYDDFCQRETDAYLVANPQTLHDAVEGKRHELRERYTSFSDEMIGTMALEDAKREIRKHIPLPTLEEFASQKEPSTDFSLKPVAVPPTAELASADTLEGESDAIRSSDTPIAQTEPVIDGSVPDEINSAPLPAADTIPAPPDSVESDVVGDPPPELGVADSRIAPVDIPTPAAESAIAGTDVPQPLMLDLFEIPTPVESSEEGTEPTDLAA